MDREAVTVEAVIDEQIFRQFTLFDLLKIKRVWRGPVLFALLMAGFSSLCFLMRGRAEGAALLGGVLLAVGLVLPALYAVTLLYRVRVQVKSHGLETPRAAYTLTLSGAPDGVAAQNPAGQSARYEWKRLYGVWRNAGCVYLYVTKSRAFILPEAQAKGGALWEMVRGNMQR